MDFISGAKQRIEKLALVYAGRIYRAKKTNTLTFVEILRRGALRAMIRLLVLVMFLLLLPSLVSVTRSATSGAAVVYGLDPDPDTSNYFKVLPILCRDMIDEGLIRKGDNGLIVGAGSSEIDDDYVVLEDAGVDLKAEARLEEVVEHDAFDFVFAPFVGGIKVIDRAVKDGGLVISPASSDLLNELHLLSNYRVVYIRVFNNTVVAMRKIGNRPA